MSPTPLPSLPIGISLDVLAAFARVAECRSFSAAARKMQVTPSALSHSLRQLEDTLQMRLLHRTTRSVTPTEAGQLLLERLTPALHGMQDALHEVRSIGPTPTGKLRLNVPRQAARMLLMPLLAEFHQRCPLVELEIVTDDALVDIVGQGFDAGIRFGERLANDMVAMPLKPVPRFIVVGSPRYLAQRGVPMEPAELKEHACINRRFPRGALYAWEFAKDHRAMEVQVQGPLTLDDDYLILEAARSGLGLAYLYEDLAADSLERGELQCVLDAWCPPTDGFHLYYPSRRHVPAALRVLMELLRGSAEE